MGTGRGLILFFFLCTAFTATGQVIIDSLERVLSETTQDTGRIKLMNEIAWACRNNCKEKGESYVRKAIKLSEAAGYLKGLAMGHHRLARIHLNNNKPLEGRSEALKSIDAYRKLKDSGGEAMAMIFLSESYEDEDLQRALSLLKEAEKLFVQVNDTLGVIATLNNAGIMYMNRNRLPEALSTYFQAYKIAEDGALHTAAATCLTNIAIIYKHMKDYARSLESFKKAAELITKGGDRSRLSTYYNNIGAIYYLSKDIENALVYFNKSAAIDEEFRQLGNLPGTYNNLGACARGLGKYDEALEYYQKAMVLKEKINDLDGIMTGHHNIGLLYIFLNNPDKAREHQLITLEMARRLDKLAYVEDAYMGLFMAEEKAGNFEKALDYHKKFIAVKDSIYTAESNRQLQELQTQFETEKKEKEISLLTRDKTLQELLLRNKETELQRQQLVAQTQEKELTLLSKDNEIQQMLLDQRQNQLARQELISQARSREVEILSQGRRAQQAELGRQRVMIQSAVAGLLLLLVLAFVIFRGYRSKQLANRKLAETNEKITGAYRIIEQNRDEIAQKNKDITDSINYAQKIQQAILPSADLIRATLPESFVLFKPKDIVSGDFYFFAAPEGKKGRIYLAVCDCTGHGVPGAFMSMIGHNQLSHLIIENRIQSPARILQLLNINIRNSLNQHKHGGANDGMDLALCAMEWKEDKLIIDYAGAFRPLWLTQRVEAEAYAGEAAVLTRRAITQIKADKVSIGGMTSGDYEFREHRVVLEKGDSFYLFSDGYADQFGGDTGKKFKTSRLKNLIEAIADKPAEEQKSILEQTLNLWQGGEEQVDDICMIGARIV